MTTTAPATVLVSGTSVVASVVGSTSGNPPTPLGPLLLPTPANSETPTTLVSTATATSVSGSGSATMVVSSNSAGK